MPRSLAANIFTICDAWVERAYRRDYFDGEFNLVGTGWRVRAICCGHSDDFYYSGCVPSPGGYVFEDEGEGEGYDEAVAFANNSIGKSRISAVECWVECY